MAIISVITVVRNDIELLKETEKSIVEQRNFGADIEWIIIDGCSYDGTVDYFAEHVNQNVDIFCSEKDDGIYDAMNKGINRADGTGLLFLNAGDYVVGNVLSRIGKNEIPCFLKVKFTNCFKKLETRKIVNERLGISNCHQGIVFENHKKIVYDLKYAICADYKYFLDHGYTAGLPLKKGDGYIYWNQGLSLQKWEERDQEIFEIRKIYFGTLVASIYEVRHWVKRIIRKTIFKQL